jgi:Cu/Ag efflux protein CusF
MTPRIFAVILTLAVLAGCASKPPSGRMEDVQEARATITNIDQQRRMVTLQSEKGDQIVLDVPDTVRNFDQLRVGDQVAISYTEAIAWQVKPASQGAPGIKSEEGVTRAKPGEKPGGTARSSVTVTTTITGIDLDKGTVTLTGPGGRSQTIKARDPANLKKVKIGDLVDITYSEALAIAVHPVGKK